MQPSHSISKYESYIAQPFPYHNHTFSSVREGPYAFYLIHLLLKKKASANLINDDYFIVFLIVLKVDQGSAIVQNGEIRSSKFRCQNYCLRERSKSAVGISENFT